MMKRNLVAVRVTLMLLVASALAIPHSSAAATSGANARLAAAVNVVSADLGYPRSSLRTINAAKLPPSLARSLAAVLEQVHVCHTLVTPLLDAARQRAADEDVSLGAPEAVAGLDSAPVLNCGAKLSTRAASLQSVAKLNPPKRSLNLWPALRVSAGSVRNTYIHDYAVQLDMGSNDSYLNNAGGSALDLIHGPKSSKAPRHSRAVGCEIAFSVLAPTCVLYSAVLVDLQGDDSYGRLEAPGLDALCTEDAVARRTTTIGGAIFGVGVFRDAAGNDRYVGKTVTLGAAHFGYGSFFDGAGKDRYTAIRVAAGSGQISGQGIHRDRGGDDVYTYYSPRPSIPGAPATSPGSGGIVDDRNQCNAKAGFMLGSGDLSGIGRFVNSGGDDRYKAAADSLAVGSRLGRATFKDLGMGVDVYLGRPGVGNGVTFAPTAENNASFRDDG